MSDLRVLLAVLYTATQKPGDGQSMQMNGPEGVSRLDLCNYVPYIFQSPFSKS